MSDTTSQQTQTTQQSQTDNRNVLGQGAILAQGGSTVTVTTLDAAVATSAIDASTKDLKTSLDFGLTAGSRAFDFARKAQVTALDSLNVEANLVKNAYADAKGRGALTDKILIGAIAMSGLVAIAALRK